MKTELHISHENINEEEIRVTLNLKPQLMNEVFIRYSPQKLWDQTLKDHIYYWYNLFKYRKEERNILIRKNYIFTLYCLIENRKENIDLDLKTQEILHKIHFDLKFTYKE